MYFYLHFLVTEGGEDPGGRFHHLASFQESLLAGFFSQEFFAVFFREVLILETAEEKILGRRHSDFSVHSRVRAVTKTEAE